MPETGQVLALLVGYAPLPSVGGGQVLGVFVSFAAIAILILVGFYAAVAVRRWIQREDKVQSFTFQDLRDMRARGEINEQEFAAMRGALLAQFDVDEAHGASSPPGIPPASAGPGSGPGSSLDDERHTDVPPPDESPPADE